VFGNFEPTLTYKGNGRRLETCGPLVWTGQIGPQAAQSVSVDVTIRQGNVVATGTSPDEFDNSEHEWMFYVKPKPGDKFVDGPAQAEGTFTVTNPGGDPPETFAWQQTVQLRAR